MSILDDPGAYERLDPFGMRLLIAGLPGQVRRAWDAARALGPQVDPATPDQVLVLGMGGSAIAGDLLAALVALESPVPVRVVRGYSLPPGLGERSLVVACSHSGDTEETLAAFEDALATPARKAVITTGGRLAGLAMRHGIPVHRYEFPHQPRAAVAHLLMPLLWLATHTGILKSLDAALAEAFEALEALRAVIAPEVPEQGNPAKLMGWHLQGGLAVFFGAEHLAPVAARWRTQVNENAKAWAASYQLPEADHNVIAGFGLPRRVVASVRAVFIESAALHPRTRLRYQLTRAELESGGAAARVWECPGGTPLAQLLAGVLVGDHVSLYLALLNGVDPTPVEPISRLKARLAEG